VGGIIRMVGGLRSEPWAPSAQNAGRLQIGIGGRLTSETAFQISFHERTIGKLLTKLRFRRLSVRPRHPESDVAAQAAFKGASLIW
jgi:hypothetical protein